MHDRVLRSRQMELMDIPIVLKARGPGGRGRDLQVKLRDKCATHGHASEQGNGNYAHQRVPIGP